MTIAHAISRAPNFAQVVPPWSIPVHVSGNTFLHTNPEFSPKVMGRMY